MQLIFNFRNVAIGAVLAAGAYYGHRSFFADIGSRDVAKLVRSYREAQPARQLLIKRRILELYQPSHDYDTFFNALDSPSPITQALAAAVLAAKGERRAVPKLLDLLRDTGRAETVTAEVAAAFALLPTREAVPRLIELTDVREPIAVRSAAHNTLRELTRTGGEIKFGDATRQHWSLWWRDHPNSVPD